MRLIAVVLALGSLVVACAEAGEPQIQEPIPDGSAAAGGCFEPSLASVQVLAGGITAEGGTLAVNAIPATETEALWYIAGELEGKAFEGDGDTALWATAEDPADEAFDFAAVNALAIEESEWEPEADIAEDDPAVEKLFACVDEAVQKGTAP